MPHARAGRIGSGQGAVFRLPHPTGQRSVVQGGRRKSGRLARCGSAVALLRDNFRPRRRFAGSAWGSGRRSWMPRPGASVQGRADTGHGRGAEAVCRAQVGALLGRQAGGQGSDIVFGGPQGEGVVESLASLGGGPAGAHNFFAREFPESFLMSVGYGRGKSRKRHHRCARRAVPGGDLVGTPGTGLTKA